MDIAINKINSHALQENEIDVNPINIIQQFEKWSQEL